MMLVFERKQQIFVHKEVWFAPHLFDLQACDLAVFQWCGVPPRNNGLGFILNHTAKTYVIDLTQPLDTVWNGFSHTCRNLIKRAERDGLEIHRNRHRQEFYELYRLFATNKGITPYSRDRYDLLMSNSVLFTALVNDEVVAGQAFLEGRGTLLHWIAASKRLESGMSREMLRIIGEANRLMHWVAINYAKERGIMEFDLGGIDTVSRGVAEFKRQFGGKVAWRYRYQKVYSPLYKVFHAIHNLTR